MLLNFSMKYISQSFEFISKVLEFLNIIISSSNDSYFSIILKVLEMNLLYKVLSILCIEIEILLSL